MRVPATHAEQAPREGPQLAHWQAQALDGGGRHEPRPAVQGGGHDAQGPLSEGAAAGGGV